MNDEIIPLEDDIYEEEIEVEEETAVMNAMWGNISGNIENQTDLQQALDAKQDNLTQAQLDAVNSGITSAKVATYDGYPAQITSAVSSEADIRRQADTTLQSNIDAEERARKAADKDIQDVLDGETLARQNADNALGGRIDTEIHDRQVADNGLQSQIDAITSKSDVVDVVANYAALQAYDTSTLGNNDVVKVLDDETHGDAMTYYRWSTTTQTWSYIGQEAPYYTKSQTDTLLLDKQDKIDATHKLSADLVDDTSTTNKFVTAQDKTNWDAKQDALTAGNNIDITGTTISTPAIAPEVVAELPTTGAEGKLYLTPKNYTRGTGTGNPITATITDEAGKMESFKLDGDTFQQTYTGKNLFNGVPYSNPSQQGITTTITNTNTIHIKGTSDNTYSNITDLFSSELPAGTYTFCVDSQQTFRINLRTLFAGGGYSDRSIQAGDTSVTFTTGTAISGLRVFMATGGTGVYFDTTFTLQLISGSTPDYNFEPYVGGQASPSPDYPQQIQTVTGEQTVTVLGKNLWGGFASDFSKTSSGVTFVNKADGTITANGTSTGTALSLFFTDATSQNRLITLNTGDYIISGATNVVRLEVINTSGGVVADTSGSVSGAKAFSISEPIQVAVRAKMANTYVADNVTIKPMLEKGSTATTYEPYSSNDYEINLGKNLWSATTLVTGYYKFADGGLVTGGNHNYVTSTEKIDVTAGESYHISADKGVGVAGSGCVFFNNDTFVSSLLNPSGSNFTVPEGANKMAFNFFSNAGLSPSEVTHIQLEVGSTATDYAPYFKPIELCKLDTYQDYIYKDGDDWKVHKATDKYVYNNDLGENGISSSYVSMLTPVLPVVKNLAHDSGICRSNMYIPADQNGTGLSGTTGTNRIRIYTALSIADSYDAVRQLASDGNLTIYYPLATPTDTTITDTNLIAQLEAIRTAALEKGANTITNTAAGSNLAGDMEIGYYEFNPTNRYDKFIWLDLNNNYEQIGS